MHCFRPRSWASLESRRPGPRRGWTTTRRATQKPHATLAHGRPWLCEAWRLPRRSKRTRHARSCLAVTDACASTDPRQMDARRSAFRRGSRRGDASRPEGCCRDRPSDAPSRSRENSRRVRLCFCRSSQNSRRSARFGPAASVVLDRLRASQRLGVRSRDCGGPRDGADGVLAAGVLARTSELCLRAANVLPERSSEEGWRGLSCGR